MKPKQLFIISILVGMLSLATALASPVLRAYSVNDENKVSEVVCRKTELWEVKYSPTGKLLEKSVYVRFEIYNNGSFPVRLRIVDRLELINSSTLSVLYGTPTPTFMESFGNISRIVWENVTLEAGKTVRYHYTAESLRSSPISVNMTLLVNGKKAKVTEAELIYFTKANLSDTVSFKLTLQNNLQPLYVADNRTAIQPLFCTVSLALSNDYFSGIKTSPKVNSTSTLADKTVITWITFLGNNSKTVEASADVIDVGSWGEVVIDPIVIQVSSSSETLKTYFENMVNSLNFSIELMENFISNSDRLSNQTHQIAKALEEIASKIEQSGMPDIAEQLRQLVQSLYQISAGADQTRIELESSLSELKRERTDLKDVLLTFNSKIMVSFDLEIRPENGADFPLTVQPKIEKLGDNGWAVTAINVSNPAGNDRFLYGLSIQLKTGDTLLEPQVETYVNGKWSLVESKKLGLEYYERNRTLYTFPWIRLNSSSTANLLLDWAGRPLRLKLKCESEPEASVKIDYAELHDWVEVTATEAQTSYSILQPHLIIRNATTPKTPTPPPSPEKNLLDILTEYLQRTETWLTIILFLTVLTCYKVFRKAKKQRALKTMQKRATVIEDADVERLLKEIKEMEKRLKG